MFSSGQYEPVDQDDVLNNYFPYMVFYKQINKKNKFFTFSEFANLPTKNLIAQEEMEEKIRIAQKDKLK